MSKQYLEKVYLSTNVSKHENQQQEVRRKNNSFRGKHKQITNTKTQLLVREIENPGLLVFSLQTSPNTDFANNKLQLKITGMLYKLKCVNIIHFVFEIKVIHLKRLKL